MKSIVLSLILALAASAAFPAAPRDVVFTANYDRSEQRYVLVLPEGFDPSRPHDLLVCLHGHGSDRWQFVRDGRDETRAARDAAARNHMIFAAPDYRAKTSWMGPAAEADMLQIFRELKKQYKIGRVILSGGSMGASGALTFTALHPDLVDGVVALNGLADHVTYTHFQEAIAASFGGSKTQVPGEYRKRSALYFPKRFTMPLAVTAGGKDQSVPPDSVLKLARAAQAGNPFVLIDFQASRAHATDYAAALAAYQFVIQAPAVRSARVSLELNGRPLPPAHGSVAGVWFYAAAPSGAQALLTGHAPVPGGWRLNASLNAGDTLRLVLDPDAAPSSAVQFQAEPLSPGAPACRAEGSAIMIQAGTAPGAVRLGHFSAGGVPLTLVPQRREFSRAVVACSPDPRQPIAEALIEWDWRMQDGIGTPREPRTYAQATERLLARMAAAGLDPPALKTLQAERPGPGAAEPAWEVYWLKMHRARRRLMLADPLFAKTPLLFLKHVPSVMSHQLTQVYGYCSRPGGGLFLLEEPGASMRTRDITPPALPPGNFMTPELSFDARKLLFAYCPVKEVPVKWGYNQDTQSLRYHLYELNLAGGAVRQLTRGDTDNFFPVCLPSGDILFSSTRRGGYHRCGSGPCFVYTLSRMSAGGQHPHSVSFHETNEWDPSLLHDGRVVYTRWDYVDRNAVHYQQLWSARQDGSNTRIYYGNNTWNPTGIWEARAVPGSSRVMATAAPHHGMSAGSVVLLDTRKGVDGKDPLTRLTQEVRFPESESPLARGPNPAQPFDFDTEPAGYWRSPLRESWMENTPTEQENRWPGHCYKSPWPLSESRFLVSYSFDRQVGEPGPNIPNMFGIYFADAFGNKELLYRDPSISSLWVRPLAPRTPPPGVAAVVDAANAAKNVGTFFLSDVYESWPRRLSGARVTHLRIIQMLLKTTPNIDAPKVAQGLGAPGRQVLGTVPVEPDGSACFEAPAGVPLLFQALDARGRAVQTMRSLVYLQPGEQESCFGCHENRMSGRQPRARAAALRRAPSRITPGPDGSRPFSYPRLVQPVLDRHCLRCHDGKAAGRPVLTGAPEGAFSKSYQALIKYVSYSAWNGPDQNGEPMTYPGRFGAVASPLAKMLEAGHNKVALTPHEWECLDTWMDANAAFYGTFDVAKQRKQLAGQVIAPPRN